MTHKGLSRCKRVSRCQGDFGTLFMTTQMFSYCTQLGSEQSNKSLDFNLLKLQLTLKIQLQSYNFCFCYNKSLVKNSRLKIFII